MVGGSYGGGVQWAAAAFDHRIDAIVPDISWHSLATSLDPNDTAKTGWDTLLYGGAQAAGQRDDPRIDKAFVDARASFRVPADDVRFLAARGPDGLVSGVRAPALILQGTVDTLFPLDEAGANYAELARERVPVKMVWFCGGHGVCLTNPGDTSVIERDTLAWLARYVKQQPVSTGPGFEWIDQVGDLALRAHVPHQQHGARRPGPRLRQPVARGHGRVRPVRRPGPGRTVRPGPGDAGDQRCRRADPLPAGRHGARRPASCPCATAVRLPVPTPGSSRRSWTTRRASSSAASSRRSPSLSTGGSTRSPSRWSTWRRWRSPVRASPSSGGRQLPVRHPPHRRDDRLLPHPDPVADLVPRPPVALPSADPDRPRGRPPRSRLRTDGKSSLIRLA